MLAALTLGCSNRRNTSATRAYHEFTTRYNIYHNALKTYNQLIEDEFTTTSINWFNLLSIHSNEFIANKTIPGGLFDVVIEKTTQAIIEHSISSKPKRDPSKAHSTEYRHWLKQEEFNPYLKNSWLLMGKAHIQNGDYNEALTVFAEIQRIYPHDINLIYETQLWMLRSYVALHKMYDAKNMVYLLQSQNLPPSLTHLYNQEYANYLLHNKEFDEAIPYLIKTINSEKIYLQKKRLQFLLGQVYIIIGDKGNAYTSFNKIKSLNTPQLLNKNASIYQAVISNNSQQNKFYNDSLSQVIKQNIRPTNNDNLQTYYDSVDTYSTQSIVRVKTHKPIDNTNTKSETSKLLEKLMEELNNLNSEFGFTKKVVSSSLDSSISIPNKHEAIEYETIDSRISPSELKSRLEQNAEKALKRSNASSKVKSREQLLKNREKLRQTKLKERDKELRERERKREVLLKQREKERQNRIKKQK